MTEQLVLRDYQIECIEAMEREFWGNGLVDSATGSGKTCMFAYFIHKRLSSHGHRALILVHRDHLVRQVCETFNKFYPEDRIGIVKGVTRQWDFPIVVASIMTATRDVDIMPTDFAVVITDEAHRAICPSYFRVYQRLDLINEKVFEELVIQAGEDDIKFQKSERVRRQARDQMESMKEDDPERDRVRSQMRDEVRGLHSEFHMAREQQTSILNLDGACEGIIPDRQSRKHLGLTATAQRTDELGLGTVFSDVLYTCKAPELIDKNQLCDLRILPISFRCSKTELRAMLRDGLADNKIVGLWKEHASDRLSTIVFAMNIAHAEHLSEAFQNAGIDARPIHSKQPTELRLQNEQDFRDGKLPVLINVGIFIEGFDVPMLDCIVMARDTDSATLLPQALGRGTRIHPDKDDCLVIDVGATIDPEKLFEMSSIFRTIKYGADVNPSGFEGFRDPKPGEEHEMFAGAFVQLASLINESDTDSVSWVPYVKFGGIALNLARNEWISIGQHADDDSLYAAAYEKDGDRELICKGKESVHICKDEGLRWLLDNNMTHLIRDRKAEWRMNQATRLQKAILNKYGVNITESCTRGEASDLIATALRNS